ncbi:membrane glycoprotein US6 [Panine betaherpesvirus 2]|uniref:Membrane glycoprotein US6 n=1 Tax=Panine betaherpesvirus 2 TaxID=188763 RepID=Q8QRV3_9BETA|nr:membrane glycoprotein US6 [Panine betaherpesvirus 2]AAM00785.1 membrane glycoprotein US6 [Panine betaherpesvirus 2]QXV67899.1 membrane glycoprotein US6 [Panine betaherpesvirus 2]
MRYLGLLKLLGLALFSVSAGRADPRDAPPEDLLSLFHRRQTCVPKKRIGVSECRNGTEDCDRTGGEEPEDDAAERLTSRWIQTALESYGNKAREGEEEEYRHPEGLINCRQVSRLLPCNASGLRPSHRLLLLMSNCVCEGPAWGVIRFVERHGLIAVSIYLFCMVNAVIFTMVLLCGVRGEQLERSSRRCGS